MLSFPQGHIKSVSNKAVGQQSVLYWVLEMMTVNKAEAFLLLRQTLMGKTDQKMKCNQETKEEIRVHKGDCTLYKQYKKHFLLSINLIYPLN